VTFERLVLTVAGEQPKLAVLASYVTFSKFGNPIKGVPIRQTKGRQREYNGRGELNGRFRQMSVEFSSLLYWGAEEIPRIPLFRASALRWLWWRNH